MTNSCLYKSPIGVLCIVEENGKITKLHLQREEDCNGTVQEGKKLAAVLREACTQLDEYFQGKRKQFELPLSYAGTDFQQRVWDELQKIPYGETRSYEEIAMQAGNSKAQRAVGQANNRNPIMIVIPCHRVIHKSGDISGYACGIEAKRYLLELEKRCIVRCAGLATIIPSGQN
ncbi:MAG: methylated-DNA--[protein]-cysteine S-methyltransferase [Lachnospiraceae bacterium]|nr:methylated-DNA--[protein]-cysteine S-methyltransferase [Lachnospiraceae bacterium]